MFIKKCFDNFSTVKLLKRVTLNLFLFKLSDSPKQGPISLFVKKIMLHSNNRVFFLSNCVAVSVLQKDQTFSQHAFVIALRYYTKIERLGFKTKQELIVRHDF